MKRREFISSLLFLPLFVNSDYFISEVIKKKENQEAKNLSIFNHIISIARKSEWRKLPLGICIGQIGYKFIDTPYVPFTLENKGKEICKINLSGLDCVTFFEASLCLARTIKKGKYKYSNFIDEVIYTRYRNGEITDYTSRLHYTSDWIYDNIKKGVVKDITKEIGGEKIKFHLNFMSSHPKFYNALKENPKFVKIMSNIEKDINKRTYYFIPKDKIKDYQKYFKTGDIVAFVTCTPGLDYSHTGLIYRNRANAPRLLHASSAKKKVILDEPIDKYICNINKDVGITVVRPII